MGKKSGRNGGETKGDDAAAFVLKVAMHCHCNGCIVKIRAAVKDLTVHPGIEAVDQSALESKGELKLLATADPEKLRHRLHKATGKHVDLVLPKPAAKAANKDAAATAAAVQALLRDSMPAQYGQGAWANQLLPGAGAGWNTLQQGSYGYGAAAAAYPWAVHVQQPDAYAAYPSAYPPPPAAGVWGAYAYPPAQQGHGAYGGGAWHGHGY